MKQFDHPTPSSCLSYANVLEHIHFSTFSTCLIMIPCWLQVKTMLERHRLLRDNIGNSFRMLQRQRFYSYCFQLPTISLINRLKIISVIFHFHYQWDESDLKQRNIIAVDEHMTILSALICRSDLDATLVLRNHLN